jgi:hypothetical protein
MPRETFMALDPPIRALILAILGLDDTMNTSTDKITEAVMQIQEDTAPAIVDSLMGSFEQRFGGVIGGQGSLMDQLSLRGTLMNSQIAEWRSRRAALEQAFGPQVQYNDEWRALGEAIAKMGAEAVKTGKDLALLVTLSAQYGEEKAEELFELQKWYEQQKALIGNNQEALLALEKLFGDKKAAILAEQTDEAIDEMQRVKERLRGWLGDLLLNSNLTILSPKAQMMKAGEDFSALLSLARSGDVSAAGKLQDAGQTYLDLAKAFFGSNSASGYVSIFDIVTGAIRDFAGSGPMVSEGGPLMVNDKIVSAIPEGSKLASQADMERVEFAVMELTTLLQQGISVSDTQVRQQLQRLADSGVQTKGAALV